MTKIASLLLLATLAAGLTGCGQKGPLRRQDSGNLAVVIAAQAPETAFR
ncbi:MAG: lipoprotein [Gammaproteobacteria bacterium]